MSVAGLEHLLRKMEKLDKGLDEYNNVLSDKLKISLGLLAGGAVAGETVAAYTLTDETGTQTIPNKDFDWSNVTSDSDYPTVVEETLGFQVPKWVNSALQSGVSVVTITNFLYDTARYERGELSKKGYILRIVGHGLLAIGSKFASWMSRGVNESTITAPEGETAPYTGSVTKTNYLVPSLISLGALGIEGVILLSNLKKGFKESKKINRLEDKIESSYQSGLGKLEELTEGTSGVFMIDTNGDGAYDTNFQSCTNDIKKTISGLFVMAYPELKNAAHKKFYLNQTLNNPSMKNVYKGLLNISTASDEVFYKEYIKTIFNNNPLKGPKNKSVYKPNKQSRLLNLKADALSLDLERLGMSYEDLLKGVKEYVM
ncbi:hypothetical protein GF352_01975 [archaeon]|nr:hypothetical protein [archaeon]